MTRAAAIKGGVAVTLLLVAGGMFAKRATQESRSADFPDGTLWVCTQPDCGHGFTKSVKELATLYSANPDADVPCPKCGKPAVRAIRCPKCGELIPRPDPGARRVDCPHCGGAIRGGKSAG